MGDRKHRRADWRFLLPDGPRSHTLIVERSPADDRHWQWLVEDGWTERLSVADGRSRERAPDHPRKADVILVRSGGDLTVALDRAGATASIVVELPRSARELVRPTADQLVTAGFDDVRSYLVTPNLDGPRRLTPLAGSGGMRWLLGPPPFSTRGRIGRSAAAAIRAGAITVAATALSTRLGALAGHRLLVAGRGLGSTGPAIRPGGPGRRSGGAGGTVLLTSGHDEGSRVILVPLGDGRTEPREVLKIAPRPRFNHNVEMETEVLETLRSKMAGRVGRTEVSRIVADDAPTRLLPRPMGSVKLPGGLVGSREGYAGRWTASDLGHRQPQSRDRVLAAVLAAATDLATATGTGAVPWSDALFDRLIVQLHDRHGELVGRTGERDGLIAALAERSQRLVGRPLPMMRRHYDLGPWNVVFGPDGRPTVIDWELAPPRRLDGDGPAGADHLHFAKYWLHICLGTRSINDELTAFEFLGPRPVVEAGDDRQALSTALRAEFDALGIDHGFVPLLAGHIWLEKGLYTMARRDSNSAPDPGEAGAYLDALARHHDRLLDHWAPGPE